MKKCLFFSAAILMLAACSNDEVVPQINEGQKAPKITLNLESGGLLSRAARPVYSSEAANDVKEVKLVVYNASNQDVTTTVLGDAATIVWTPATGTTSQEVQFISGALTNGSYTIIAYGYNDAADFTISPPATFTEAEKSFTATPTGDVAEMFAGYLTINVSNGDITEGETILTMERQVAGMLGYFKNIPVKSPDDFGVPQTVQYIRVIASASSDAFKFPCMEDKQVNSINTPGEVPLLNLDLSTLITDYATQIASEEIDETTTFTIPAATTPAMTIANSILSGRFLIPFSMVDANTPTLRVELVGQDGTTILKTWNVKNASNAHAFNIERNAFYSIGQKLKANSVNGNTEPTAPGTDPNDPTSGTGDPNEGDDDTATDLSISTDITVTVNDAWEVVYQLGLE